MHTVHCGAEHTFDSTETHILAVSTHESSVEPRDVTKTVVLTKGFLPAELSVLALLVIIQIELACEQVHCPLHLHETRIEQLDASAPLVDCMCETRLAILQRLTPVCQVEIMFHLRHRICCLPHLLQCFQVVHIVVRILLHTHLEQVRVVIKPILVLRRGSVDEPELHLVNRWLERWRLAFKVVHCVLDRQMRAAFLHAVEEIGFSLLCQMDRPKLIT